MPNIVEKLDRIIDAPPTAYGAEIAEARNAFARLHTAAENFRAAMIESGALNHVPQDQYMDPLRYLERVLAETR